VLAGPTASGKSELALRVAERLGAEIVSADSQQIYRFFDIGTAKPAAQVLARIPHHLVSIVDPNEAFSAARFQTLADEAIRSIGARRKPPLIVGGTGLYMRVLLHGVVAAPGADPELRKGLERVGDQLGTEALYQRLRAVDAQSADSLQPGDRVRIIRALEIFEKTGIPASEFRRAHRFAEDRYRFSMVVLTPPREELYRAIDRRTRAMFEAGLVDEVRSLVDRGFRDAAPMRSVGYAQALAVVEGRMQLTQAVEEAGRETRHYAKRQMTWFRRERGASFFWPPDVEELLDRWSD
jgi:tRNA dimethylallyltransferase